MRLRRLEPVLRQALHGPCRLPRGSRLLVAVSGGADSTALLEALASIAHEFELALTAAHLHHGLRGAAADADLEHVRAQCARLAVPLVAARWNAPARMRRESLAGEAGLRTLRRRFLLAAAKRHRAAAIATAHTADDQLETVLMRLARGTGLTGLGGMRPRHGAWLKPALGATRFEIERDLVAARIAWREDASNHERAFLRNRIRLDVVPALLAAISPPPHRIAEARAGLARRVAAAAGEARGGARLAARAARPALARRLSPGARSVDARGLGSRPGVILHSLLRLFWNRANPRSSGLPRRHVEALARLLRGGPGGEITLPERWRAVLVDGRLTLVPPRSPRRPMPAASPAAGGIRGKTRTNARLRAGGRPVARA